MSTLTQSPEQKNQQAKPSAQGASENKFTLLKSLRYLALGILFGIILTKSEVVSWFRIQEMFRFDAFHMYGVIGSTVLILGMLVFLLKKFYFPRDAEPADLPGMLRPKAMSIPRYLIGGTIFGLGWALTGACPGPIYALMGQGFASLLVVFASALAGTYAYGLLRDKLPH